MGIFDLDLLSSLHPSWKFALFQFLPFYLIILGNLISDTVACCSEVETDFLNGSPNYVTVALLGCLFLFPSLDKEGLSPWQKIPGNNTIHCGDYV